MASSSSSSDSSSSIESGRTIVVAYNSTRITIDTQKVETVGVAKYLLATQVKLDPSQCTMIFGTKEVYSWQKIIDVAPVRETGILQLINRPPITQKLGLIIDDFAVPARHLKTGDFVNENILVYCKKSHSDDKCVQNGIIRIKCSNCQNETISLSPTMLSNNPSWAVILENTANIFGHCFICDSKQRIEFYFKCKGSTMLGNICNNYEEVIPLPDVERGAEFEEHQYYIQFPRCDHRLPLTKDLLDGRLYPSLLRGRRHIRCPEEGCDQQSCIFLDNLTPLGCARKINWQRVMFYGYCICRRCFGTYLPSSSDTLMQVCQHCQSIYCKAHDSLDCCHDELTAKIEFIVAQGKRQQCRYGCDAPLEYPESVSNTKAYCSKCFQPACYVCGKPDHYLPDASSSFGNCCNFDLESFSSSSPSLLAVLTQFHKSKIIFALKISIAPLIEKEDFKTISITIGVQGENWTYHITYDDIF